MTSPCELIRVNSIDFNCDWISGTLSLNCSIGRKGQRGHAMTSRVGVVIGKAIRRGSHVEALATLPLFLKEFNSIGHLISSKLIIIN